MTTASLSLQAPYSQRGSGGASRERVLSHLLNSSFAATPLILPSSIAAREGAHSLVNPSSPPLFMPGAWRRRAAVGGAGGLYRRPYTLRACAGELRASRLSFC